MALFGTTKKEKKDKKANVARKHRARTTKLASGVAHEVIRAPWFSEKALMATEKGVYTFNIPARVTKAEVAAAVKEVYKVEPRKVRVVNLPGKPKAMRTKRGIGYRAARRKAYVYLNAGDSIQFG